MRATSSRWGWCAVVALLAVLVGARPAEAQGLYYKEIRKDERIYVFNNAEEAARFEASGEMGRGITRPGTGPNGETVVGDSERALQLFYFKHNISEAVPEPTPPLQRIEWRDGKTRISTDFAYLEISNRVQGEIHARIPGRHLSPILPGTGAAGDTKGSFRIRRAKFKLEGWFWSPPKWLPGFRPERLPRPAPCRSCRMSYSSTGRRSAPTSARSRATSARSSRTPTSPGTRRAWASFASCSASTRRRSGASR